MPESALGITHRYLSRETIKRSESEQTKFKQLVSTSKSYSEIEKAVIKFETFTQFDEFWQTTVDSKEEFDQDHERGCGLCSKNFQSSAVMARDFMRDFSPIIDLVKDFAAPYGGVAVGTISVFFAVGVTLTQSRNRELRPNPGRGKQGGYGRMFGIRYNCNQRSVAGTEYVPAYLQ